MMNCLSVSQLEQRQDVLTVMLKLLVLIRRRRSILAFSLRFAKYTVSQKTETTL